MQKIISIMLTLLGCAGVVPMAQGAYIIVERQAATGLSGAVGAKLEALREATKQCEALGKGMRVVPTESQPPYPLGKYPREIQLKCLPKR